MARMTRSDRRQIERLIKKLTEAQDIAEKLELTLSNGGEIGGIIGTVRDELEVRRDQEAA